MEAINLEPVKALCAQFRRLRGLYLLCLIAAVLALVCYFVNQAAALAVLAFSLIGYVALVRPYSKRYERAFIHACAQYTLERHLRDAEHTGEPTLDAEELYGARLVPANRARGGVLFREGGRGTYHGRRVRLGDVVLAHSFPVEDGKTHHEFISGSWVTVELERDTEMDWRLIHNKVMLKPSREEMFRRDGDMRRLVGIREPWLNGGDWDVFCPKDKLDMPGKPFLRELERLTKRTENPLAVCVQGDRFHVFVTNRILGQKVSGRVPPQEAIAQADLLPELDGILKASDALMETTD